MKYIVDQYNWIKGKDDSNKFMQLVEVDPNRDLCERISVSRDYNTVINEESPFEEESVRFNFIAATTYYFHGKIKRMSTDQIFDVKLYNQNVDINSQTDYKEQYIKTIEVKKGVEYQYGGDSEDDFEDVILPEWVDVEFIFTPQANFDHLVFILNRIVEVDFKRQKRFPIIAFQELSVINNVLENLIDIHNNKIIKIGVQSRPGLLMCINNEEIRTSRTGIYELKSGVMTVNFFSVCNAGVEITNDLNNWIQTVNNAITQIDIKQKQGEYTDKQVQDLKEQWKSQCFFKYAKKREIDGFTLDYLYSDVNG